MRQFWEYRLDVSLNLKFIETFLCMGASVTCFKTCFVLVYQVWFLVRMTLPSCSYSSWVVFFTWFLSGNQGPSCESCRSWRQTVWKSSLAHLNCVLSRKKLRKKNTFVLSCNGVVVSTSGFRSPWFVANFVPRAFATSWNRRWPWVEVDSKLWWSLHFLTLLPIQEST